MDEYLVETKGMDIINGDSTERGYLYTRSLEGWELVSVTNPTISTIKYYWKRISK